MAAGEDLNLVAKDIADNSTEILTVDASTPLSQNVYEVKLRTKDYAGNLSAFTSLLLNDANLYVDSLITLTVDTSPFVIASDPDLLVEDEIQVFPASDNITSVSPKFQF